MYIDKGSMEGKENLEGIKLFFTAPLVATPRAGVQDG